MLPTLLAVMRSPAFRSLVGLPKAIPPVSVPAGKQESLTEMYSRYLRQVEEMQKPGEEKNQGPGTKLPVVKTFAVKQHGRRRR